MSGLLERLTEGVVNRDMRAESHALLKKWERTGLLEGLDSERNRNSMARLLENQAKELLREVNTTSNLTTNTVGTVDGRTSCVTHSTCISSSTLANVV